MTWVRVLIILGGAFIAAGVAAALVGTVAAALIAVGLSLWGSAVFGVDVGDRR